MSKTLYDSITEIMQHGTTKPKEIKKILESQYGKRTTLNSIYCVKSNIGKSKQSGHTNSNNASNTNNIDSSSEMARTQQEQFKTIPQEIQTQEETQIPQSPIVQTPINQSSVITGSKFSIQGNTAPIQIEGSEMSKAYQEGAIQQEEFENPKQTFPIKVSKLGKVSGNLLQGLYSTSQMQKMTNGYQVEESDVKDMNNDVTEMLEYRVGNNLNNPDGDLINVGIDFAIIFAKGMFHRISSNKAKKVLEEYIPEAEKNVKKALQEGAKQMQEMKKMKDSILCNNCNKQEISKNGLCTECYFQQKINTAQHEHNK
jgi:hypothetical protein